jgi:hypothetical protein
MRRNMSVKADAGGRGGTVAKSVSARSFARHNTETMELHGDPRSRVTDIDFGSAFWLGFGVMPEASMSAL